MAKEREPRNSNTGSFPAGDGGRVEYPVRQVDGIPYFVDGDEGCIVSGMAKRLAISDGSFSPRFKVPEEFEKP